MPGADDIRAQIATLRLRAAEARRRAARAAATAAGFEEQAARPSASLGEAYLRMAAMQRRVQECHLTSARLHDQYADRLGAWLGPAGEPARPPAFVDAVASAIGMRSVTVILFGRQRDEVVTAASDATARAAHDLEFVLGEGPAHSAVDHGQPVEVADITVCGRWPRYGPEVIRLGVRAVLAVPLQPAARLGAVCAYSSEPAISEEAADAADAVADALPLILSRAAHDRGPGEGDAALPFFSEADFPAVIHQAAGMVSRQCGCDVADALALLRARAFSAGRSATEIAAGVVRGDLRWC
jgi:hypothetical protein